MSFFKDFKDDLSQAVNELVADEELKEVMNEESKSEDEQAVTDEEDVVKEDDIDDDTDMQLLNELFSQDNEDDEEEDMKRKSEEKEEVVQDIESSDIDEVQEEVVQEEITEKEESLDDDDTEAMKEALRGNRTSAFEKNELTNTGSSQEAPSDELTEITKGTVLDGNIITEGSMNVYGKIKGNVACRGKLVVCGTIVGASRGAEIYTNNAKVDGDITSDGSIKIGNGSIIIGNVYGNSAVIAGAVKGDIDVHGPVIIDGTAVVQGNIRSRSVQINNGAAIEGSVSQCYAEIDYVALFDKTFAK